MKDFFKIKTGISFVLIIMFFVSCSTDDKQVVDKSNNLVKGKSAALDPHGNLIIDNQTNFKMTGDINCYAATGGIVSGQEILGQKVHFSSNDAVTFYDFKTAFAIGNADEDEWTRSQYPNVSFISSNSGVDCNQNFLQEDISGNQFVHWRGLKLSLSGTFDDPQQAGIQSYPVEAPLYVTLSNIDGIQGYVFSAPLLTNFNPNQNINVYASIDILANGDTYVKITSTIF